MKIINLTQHIATSEQIHAGVKDPVDPIKNSIQGHLTFNTLPTMFRIRGTARAIAEIAASYKKSHDIHHAMIGGAPYLMAALEQELLLVGVEPLYAFSVRESVEVIEDGYVRKTNVFRHLGFVNV